MTLLLALLLMADPTPPGGVLPLGADGKPLNLDFETGTLKDWTAEGDAFAGQPILGDTVAPRRADSKSEHQGKYWIGGFEKLGDKPTGTLTSVPFKVTHPWASFLVAGGTTNATCVEVLLGDEVIFRAVGLEEENLRRVAVDLTKHQGKEIRVRIVDKHTGHWGHVNFDDFRFHSEQPSIPKDSARTPLPDDYKYAGQTPQDAAKNMTVPPGFSVSLFAGEPDLHQPIAMCTDDRGRLWVVEAFTYPRRHPHPGPVIPDPKLGDKILIFEDTDGDGKFDKKTVFFEGLNLVSGIELGFGGVWVGAAPYLLFIPHDQATDKAGEPKILLDGWGYQDTHETLNSFIWGPDGWLYGCHGVFTHSNIGKPGSPEKERTPLNAGVWRYHPTRHAFEIFAHGTSNPWGLDYNSVGDFFVEACVIPHLWHIVQGGRYQRQAGQHFNPYTYDDIKTIAKHRHYMGNQWNNTDRLRSSDLGGGHAHSGLICYQGGSWPKEYHGKLFMGNIHGHRINVDELKPKGSSYEADRNPDFLFSNDKYCIIVALHTGPDGNVYFSDWSDKQVCHTNAPEIWDRTNGRVFKISHKDAKPVKGLDLQKLSDEELIKLQLHDNEWYVRHARRILQERATGRDYQGNTKSIEQLREIALKDENPQHRLRGLWAAHVMGMLLFQDKAWNKIYDDHSPYVRAAVVQLLQDRSEHLPLEFDKSYSDTSPVVRRALASHAIAMAMPVATHLPKLLAHAEDANDPLLPHLYWYALAASADRIDYMKSPENRLLYAKSLIEVATNSKVPLLENASRRISAAGAEGIQALVDAFSNTNSDEYRLYILRAIREGLKGRKKMAPPAGWAGAYQSQIQNPNQSVRVQLMITAIEFGDESGMADLTKLMHDKSTDTTLRILALTALRDVRDVGLPPNLHRLILEDTDMRSLAIRALAFFDDKVTPIVLLCVYPTLTPTEKRDAVNTLSSRVTYGQALLDAIAAKKIPTADVPAEIIRQLRNLNDKALDEKITAVWGVMRDSPADRKQMIADWSKKLTPTVLAQADPGHGRAVFAKVCQQCHTLFGVGGKVGPDITGANRSDLGYLLENMFDPSAVIPKEYAATKLDLIDGRVITGIVKEETKTILTVATANEVLTIPLADVLQRTASLLSMMPDDVAKQVSERDLRALVAYLKQPVQVPMLVTPETAKDFFNGKDLANWDGDKEVWKVENGEIVGSTKTGLKKNTFLKGPFDVADFKLSLKVKLTPNKENSGIQFRSVNIEGGEMRGPQADIGAGWWGKLYEESGRGLLAKEDNEKHVKLDDWNEYVVEAIGPSVKIWINGHLCTDYTDDKLARHGLIAVQVHSGGPMEVRFKDIKLEVPTAKNK